MKIAITGIANGGKTSFLTSILWHLSEAPESDALRKVGLEFENFEKLSITRKGQDAFPFEKFQDSLSRKRMWPEKTADCSHYSCVLDNKKAKYLIPGRNRQRFDFFDFPGERIADSAIAAFEDFSMWSKHMFGHFNDHSDYDVALSPYCKFLETCVKKEVPDDDALIQEIAHAYKLGLAGLCLGHKPLISPSTFRLDLKGVSFEKASDEQIASTRMIGLDAARPFAPLSGDVLEAFPELGKQMASNYRDYRKKLVLPLFEEISSSDRMIVLVDIPSLLEGGVDRFNDNRQIVNDLFDALNPGSSIGRRLLKILTFWKGGIEKIAFVASKADMVRPSDLKNGRLKFLLRQMTSQVRGRLRGVKLGWLVCAAIQSTKNGKKEDELIWVPPLENPSMELRFTPSQLPEQWESNWPLSKYKFGGVSPDAPRNTLIPPKHYGLDRLFRFLLGKDHAG